MWKDIKGYEGVYQISDDGHVRRFLKNGNSKPVKGKEGSKYYTVTLSNNNVQTTYNIHRLVAEHFLERPQNATEVNHKDGNKKNNDVSNLEWVTQEDNRIHAMEKLEKFPFGKPARRVRCLDVATGEVVAEYHSVSEAAKSVGRISARSGITLVCQGYAPSAYGYKWEYVN